ncbi:unnamed protein product [Cladocopium goreaui]|uniref:RRM domain-containing protein n=1 Tax=Cladocopium goreaui TaxID=2562237 RepID=A0A9P1CQD8_9DINO|nr:unnamed protein product [Cladocopium goreaui]|mmetsp:Transcript_52471/g.106769  ORF Transcript_52471/g.106769 Transcript_52471/m.106769 type:complete len:474 (-) Transcript_52471:32-1453(-)
MVATQAIEKDAFFEFNPSAPEFNPSKQKLIMANERYMSSPQLSPEHPALDGHDDSRRAGMAHPDYALDRGGQEADLELRALSCSPQLLACHSNVRQSQRRKQPPGRRSCGTAPASPTLNPTEGKGKSVLNRRASGEEVSTLVIKNLALDFRKEDVEKYLLSQGAGATEVELHVDPASGSFRGTVFVRYASSFKAREALQTLGPSPEIGGRKARVEVQKSKNLFGRKSASADLPQELAVVQREIDKFLKDSEKEVCLSAALDAHQRKYAHSLAERHNLVHATRQNESGQTYVFLSKCRSSQVASSRKKAYSVDIRSTPMLAAGGMSAIHDVIGGYEAHSQSCYVGPMSPPGLLFPGLDLGTPILAPDLLPAGMLDESGMFMLPSAAAPPGIEPALPRHAWPQRCRHPEETTEPPPGLEFQGLAELAEGLCNDLVATDQEDLHLDLKYIDCHCPASESISTEDSLSKRSNETDRS